MPKPHFCGSSDWKVFCCVVTLFLETQTPRRLLFCHYVHLDERFSYKEKSKYIKLLVFLT